MNELSALRQVRSIIETPILDEHKWAKLPGIAADAVMIDLEDSAPHDRKDEARTRAVRELASPEHFAGRLVMARSNHLHTPWGHDDLVALAEIDVGYVVYPKVASADDLVAAQNVLRDHGCDPILLASIESADGVVNLKEIGEVDKVGALCVGPADFCVDTGMSLYEPDGSYNPAVIAVFAQTAIVAARRGAAVIGPSFGPDLRDLADIRKRADAYQRLGFTGLITFYPPHVDVINDAFTPSAEDVAAARKRVARYEAAMAEGRAAVLGEDGETILVFDYENAKLLLRRARE